LVACLFFLIVGQAFVPVLGIENDEAIFANSLFARGGALFGIGDPGIH
jgi:hypothetical protein